MTIEEIKKIDWIKFLDRRRSCFIYFPYIEAEFKWLPEICGFGYKKHLYKWSGDKGVHYRSASELEESMAHFLKVIKDEPSRVVEWTKTSLQWTRRSEELTKKFESEEKERVSLGDFGTYYDEFVQILLWTVTIPYLSLCAIDAVLEKGESKEQFREVLTALEPLRGFTAYPQLERTMLDYFWKLLIQETGIDEVELVDKMNADEVKQFILDKTFPDIEILKKRRDWCIFVHDPVTDKIEYWYDKEIAKELPVLNDEMIKAEAVIKGRVGYPGKVTGIVKRIDNAKDMAKFNPGDIIVSINTTPDLMAVLSQCSAIVSDEGGIMCHAAIVSRELKKPCIIGTKIATKVLKDGDMVEVDAEKGVVKILK